MGLRRTTGMLAVALSVGLGGGVAFGGFVEEFTDKDEWIAAVGGGFLTVDFTGFPDGIFITDQYADLGILFTDGNDSIFLNDGAFPNDGAGLDGNGNISVAFDTPQAWIGVDFPGVLQIELFSSGRLFYRSSIAGGGGGGFFLGLVSSELFDAAVLIDPLDQAAIDDLHFGVPAPGALWQLGVAALLPRRRRRVAPGGGAVASRPVSGRWFDAHHCESFP
ncbi:MAG: hypothetical protein O6758_03015 [Planctomycetota bacterium]|nr:hypothetical protein [Planctomycetota bacterium]